MPAFAGMTSIVIPGKGVARDPESRGAKRRAGARTLVEI